jgi:hypothetical protein
MSHFVIDSLTEKPYTPIASQAAAVLIFDKISNLLLVIGLLAKPEIRNKGLSFRDTMGCLGTIWDEAGG